MDDLFGKKIVQRGKNYVEPRGYAAPPGTGVKGETCGTCKHHIVRTLSKRFHKCALIKFTSGAATDIRVRSPACRLWEKIDG